MRRRKKAGREGGEGRKGGGENGEDGREGEMEAGRIMSQDPQSTGCQQDGLRKHSGKHSISLFMQVPAGHPRWERFALQPCTIHASPIGATRVSPQ